MSTKFIELLNWVKTQCFAINSDISPIDYLEQIDSAKVQEGINSGFQHYVELKHSKQVELVRNTYAVID